ncbi:hypothetical protein F2Q68_00024873 [Brassica cretica]|uniref:F-box domain-containing protein n=1 Tax=Brassica cretica TaxID=69181 RepID=A0A8S9I915_BRACR|nr:hypothetical protein F2Q68_00024873 [Brassica cretica]
MERKVKILIGSSLSLNIPYLNKAQYVAILSSHANSARRAAQSSCSLAVQRESGAKKDPNLFEMSLTAIGSGEEPPSKKLAIEPTTNLPLPDELVLGCFARASRLHYPILSLVSKTFRSLTSSPELYQTRSLLNCTENCLYVGELLWSNRSTESDVWRKVQGLEGLPKFTRYSNVYLVASGGKLVVFWDKYVPARGGYKEKMIWCAEISLETRSSEVVWGKVEWFDAVLTVPKSYKFVYSIAATL